MTAQTILDFTSIFFAKSCFHGKGHLEAKCNTPRVFPMPPFVIFCLAHVTVAAALLERLEPENKSLFKYSLSVGAEMPK